MSGYQNVLPVNKYGGKTGSTQNFKQYTTYLGNDTRYHRNSNRYPILATTSDILATHPALSDVERLPENKMADCKPEVEYISGTERDITEIPKPIQYLRHARIGDGSTDIAQCRPTSGNQNGRQQTGSRIYLWNGKIYH